MTRLLWALAFALGLAGWALLYALGGWIACAVFAAVAGGGAVALGNWIVTGHPVPPEERR